MKFSVKDFFSKCDHLLKKSLMENFIFWAVYAIRCHYIQKIPREIFSLK